MNDKYSIEELTIAARAVVGIIGILCVTVLGIVWLVLL